MVPVLARFNGQPRVDPQGRLTYAFPDLQQTAKVHRAAPLLRCHWEQGGDVCCMWWNWQYARH